MRFGFLLKRDKPEARDLAAELVGMLRQRGDVAVISDGDASDLAGASKVDEATLAAAPAKAQLQRWSKAWRWRKPASPAVCRSSA